MGGGVGGANLGYLKKSCKQHQGEHWKILFKIKFGNFKGGARLTHP